MAIKKKDKNVKMVDINEVGTVNIFKIMIKKLVNEENFNKAEDLIFEELENNNSPEVYEIATEFYNSLMKKSDEALEKSDFTREEVYKGLEDIQKFKGEM